MTGPTPEQIEAMATRGWVFNAEQMTFRCPDLPHDQRVISLRVYRLDDDDGWWADYGVRGVSYARFNEHVTPELAAAEAEGWLRQTLGAFRFPWLEVR